MFWVQKILVSLMFFLGAGVTAVSLYFKDDIVKKFSKINYYTGGVAHIDVDSLLASINVTNDQVASVLKTLSLSTQEVKIK